jgi:ERCC4-type nuclease
MAIICDTREKANQKVIEYFMSREIPFVVRKLDTGDYMDSERMDITIDRKKDLNELMKNMCSPDSSRFWREIRRSKEENIRFIILCEHGGQYKSIKDVARFWSKYSRVTGRQLMDKMYKAHISYGVEFLFCDKRQTGKRIVELLRGDGKR